ncbi:MAG: hypothetical protein IPL95_06540 [Saprospiraceae bacterium]|nr:hypothetical protein [Saprospiraceae bacterium]
MIKYNSQNNTYIQFNSNYGFSVNYINQINEDNYGKLWMATSYGISSFDKKTYEVFNYDGQNGIGFPHNLFRGKTKDEYNNLYLSSGIGFIKIDPKIFLKTTIGPPVYIKKFSINNQEIAAFWKDTTITIDAYNNDFSFVISAINHTHGHLNKYKYILENYHEKWVNISKNQLNVSFNNLDAGQYIFRAIACNHLGDWNLKGINITINILPYWYHTWWFRLLILIIVLGLIYYIYKLVLNRKLAIQKAEFDQKTAIYNERNRIARDMHDDISSGLSAIHLIANHIQSMPNHQIFDNEINYIIKSSNEINQNIREIIWSVNSDSDTILNLSIFIKQYIYTLSESIENTSFKYYSNEKLPLIYISGEKRRNIYLCVKEAINNALKHANATYIKVIFEFNLPNIISIKIIDNGVGFDPNINLLSNYGLKNMKNRIENIGGKFSVEVNDLTTIHLEITII